MFKVLPRHTTCEVRLDALRQANLHPAFHCMETTQSSLDKIHQPCPTSAGCPPLRLHLAGHPQALNRKKRSNDIKCISCTSPIQGQASNIILHAIWQHVCNCMGNVYIYIYIIRDIRKLTVLEASTWSPRKELQ